MFGLFPGSQKSQKGGGPAPASSSSSSLAALGGGLGQKHTRTAGPFTTTTTTSSAMTNMAPSTLTKMGSIKNSKMNLGPINTNMHIHKHADINNPADWTENGGPIVRAASPTSTKSTTTPVNGTSARGYNHYSEHNTNTAYAMSSGDATSYPQLDENSQVDSSTQSSPDPYQYAYATFDPDADPDSDNNHNTKEESDSEDDVFEDTILQLSSSPSPSPSPSKSSFGSSFLKSSSLNSTSKLKTRPRRTSSSSSSSPLKYRISPEGLAADADSDADGYSFLTADTTSINSTTTTTTASRSRSGSGDSAVSNEPSSGYVRVDVRSRSREKETTEPSKVLTDDQDEDAHPSSPPIVEEPSPPPSPPSPTLSRELEALQILRQNVKLNLRLRPIRSSSKLRATARAEAEDVRRELESGKSLGEIVRARSPGLGAFGMGPSPAIPRTPDGNTYAHGFTPKEGPDGMLSPQSAVSSYFTPISDTPSSAMFPPRSAFGVGGRVDAGDNSTRGKILAPTPLARSVSASALVANDGTASVLDRSGMGKGSSFGFVGPPQSSSPSQQGKAAEIGIAGVAAPVTQIPISTPIPRKASASSPFRSVSASASPAPALVLSAPPSKKNKTVPSLLSLHALGDKAPAQYVGAEQMVHVSPPSPVIIPSRASSLGAAASGASQQLEKGPAQGHGNQNFASKPTTSTPRRPHTPTSIPGSELYKRLTSVKRPLLVDTRPLAAHMAFHVRHSVNIAIPSLILKRCKRPGGGLQSLDGVRQFVTTERGRREWDALTMSMNDKEGWDGDVVVYDEVMEGTEKDNMAWAIIAVLSPLVQGLGGCVDYLEGGISRAGHDADLETLMVVGDGGDDDDYYDEGGLGLPEGLAAVSVGGGYGSGRDGGGSGALGTGIAMGSTKGQLRQGLGTGTGGLFQLDTGFPTSASSAFLRTRPVAAPPSALAPEIAEPSSKLPPSLMPVTSSTSNSHLAIPAHTTSDNNEMMFIDSSSPSPPPSSVAFRRPAPPRRPSVPNLRRIDTKSSERLPKLTVRTKPMRSATLTVPPTLSLSIQPPQSPSHLQLVYSTHHHPSSSPPPTGTASRFVISSDAMSPSNEHQHEQYPNLRSAYYTPPHTPGTPKAFSSVLPPEPTTARPYSVTFDITDGPSSSTSSESPSPYPLFSISTILPNFLFLGPELTTPAHVEQLKELGVKRILNIAMECDEDDHGLGLGGRFERYYKIPMRDTVEEENIAKGVREVCDILDDARLHSSPTYVHCKAGKSRSVTAVMAYLIHANHWTLAKAYAFVLERRKGISPNIGFVSELMTFEETELGGKSGGVHGNINGGGGAAAAGMGSGALGEGHGPAMGLSRPYGRAAGHYVRESLPVLGVTTEGPGMGEFGHGFGGPSSSSQPGNAFPSNHPSSSSSNNAMYSSSHQHPIAMSADGVNLSSNNNNASMTQEERDKEWERERERVMLLGPGQEMEVKDASGRYRHARRAPVDENTLQPMRRVSKAGLESSGSGFGWED